MILLAFDIGSAVPVHAQAIDPRNPTIATQPAAPELRSARVQQAPVIDGVLDDDAWRESPLPTGEWQSYNPLHGDTLPQQTRVWIAHDGDYLYVAFQCQDPEPQSIKTSISRRDNVWSDDWVGLSLDTLGSGQLAYHLMVNPSGVQMDMLNSVAGGEDQSPDFVWDSAGRTNETGYAVEIRLPLQTIRFRGGPDVRMGVLFWRRVSRLGVSVSWPALKPGTWVFERHAPLYFADLQSRPGARSDPVDDLLAQSVEGDTGRVGRCRPRRRFRRQREDWPHLHHHPGRHGEPGLQPGRERRVPGRGEPAVSGVLLGEASVLHGRGRHLHAGGGRQ